MAKSKKMPYSLADSLTILSQLQQMAINEGNLSMALKAEELKCKILLAQDNKEDTDDNEDLTKILVDFINDKQNNDSK
ncbi:MAG: hypothetical protein IJ824_06530 [Alphaproteobacteria bacterium]|nr:hypothetical protein [Alphaproteobacteria bacterium]